VLDVIEFYPFCSVANQQAMLILDILKKAIDEDELSQLKSFVERNLTTDEKFIIKFSSGNQTNSSNLATIVKIGLALKEMI
jgi:hypothetical protein